MDIDFTTPADAVEGRLHDTDRFAYDRLWDVLERIAVDVDEAKHRASYVSTFQWWANQLPGTDYTVYWHTVDGKLMVTQILSEREAR